MSALTIAVVAGGVALVGGALIAVVVTVVLARRVGGARGAQHERLVRDGRPPALQASANSLGHDRAGTRQIRGAGALALTDDQVRFMLGMPRRELVIDLADVATAEAADGFRRPGYRVRTGSGHALILEMDRPEPWRVAWQLPDAGAWAVRIQEAARLSRPADGW